MRTYRKTDFRLRYIAKNNFSGIDISQGLNLEPPSLSPYFLLLLLNKRKMESSAPIWRDKDTTLKSVLKNKTTFLTL